MFVLPQTKTRRAKRQLPWHFTEINHNFTNKLTEQLCKYQVHGCLMELLFVMLCKKSSQFMVCFSTFKSSCCVHLKFRLCRAAFFYDYDYFRKWVWILRSDNMYATHIYKEHLFWILLENIGNNVKHTRFSTRIISVKILKSHLILDYFKLRKIILAMF